MNQDKYQSEDEINLRDYLNAISKRKIFILTLFLLAVVIAGIFSLLLPRVYRVDTILEIGEISGELIDSNADLAAAIDTGKYEMSIRSSLNIAEKDYPAIKVEVNENSKLLKLQIEDKDSNLAKETLEKCAELILSEHKKKFEEKTLAMGKNIEELQNSLDLLRVNKIYADEGIAALQVTISSLKEELSVAEPTKVVKEPTVSDIPVRPRPLFNMVIAGVLGLFIGVFLALAREWW